IGQVPANATNVVSTPDGAYIVAFVKETPQNVDSSENNSEINSDTDKTTNTTKATEKYFAYIYFCASFGKLDSKKRSLGQVRLSDTTQDANFSIVEGKNTNFTKDVHKGESLVLSGKKYNVFEILLDTTLKISKSFQPASNEAIEFMIEQILAVSLMLTD
ncbi:35928_t:CDS:2, partial [Racocetra persica]